MDTIRSWFSRGSDPSERVGDEQDVRSKSVIDQKSLVDGNMTARKAQKDVVTVAVVSTKMSIDPRVAEYFHDFPEPYKTKAIARFSSREGIYKWDFFRDLAMTREFEAASRGEFLEDHRMTYEALKERERSVREEMRTEKREMEVETREQSPLEKAIRSRIPVHKDETLRLKLFQTANFSLIGVLLVWSAVRLRKRNPSISKWRHYMTVGGSSLFCGYLQVVAAHRLMDWGPFDRSIDDRDAVTKQFEEIKQFFLSLPDNVMQERGKDDS